MMYWKFITGHYWLLETYTLEPGFSFLSPDFRSALFLPTKGWLFWSPICFHGILGLAINLRHKNPFSLVGLTILGFFAYLYASWSSPGLGGGYGQRGFIDFYVIVGFGLAAYLNDSDESIFALHAMLDSYTIYYRDLSMHVSLLERYDRIWPYSMGPLRRYNSNGRLSFMSSHQC